MEQSQITKILAYFLVGFCGLLTLSDSRDRVYLGIIFNKK
jgi:uncharacterized membrane protein YuzA (DUF378 family)